MWVMGIIAVVCLMVLIVILAVKLINIPFEILDDHVYDSNFVIDQLTTHLQIKHPRLIPSSVNIISLVYLPYSYDFAEVTCEERTPEGVVSFHYTFELRIDTVDEIVEIINVK